jgi:hypothetical protein
MIIVCHIFLQSEIRLGEDVGYEKSDKSISLEK